MYTQNKFRSNMTKVAFYKKKILFTCKLGLNLENKLEECSMWSTALYGVETLTLWKIGQKYLEVLKCDAREG
jgi:hypothetical protein